MSKNGYNSSLLKIYSDTVITLRSSGFTQIPILSCSSMIPVFSFINNNSVKSNINMNSIISGSNKEITVQYKKTIINMVFL